MKTDSLQVGGWAVPHPLAADEVHVYVAELDYAPYSLSALMSTLSEEELARGARFRFARAHDRYFVGRGILRVLLAGYLGVAPADVRLAAGPFGKPELAVGSGATTLGFNVSHADGIATYAFGSNRRVGIDVERVRRDVDHRALAELFFAPAEKAHLRLVSDQDLPESLFACWTRKEAVVKAHGAGLSLPLDSFEVRVRPNDPSHLVWRSAPESTGNWSLATFRPRPGFIGALAVQGAPWTLVSKALPAVRE